MLPLSTPCWLREYLTIAAGVLAGSLWVPWRFRRGRLWGHAGKRLIDLRPPLPFAMTWTRSGPVSSNLSSVETTWRQHSVWKIPHRRRGP